MKELPVVHFRSQQEWIDWLDENHASSGGVRLKLAKKVSGIESVTHREAVEAALCFGWIDGQAESVDDDFWILRFTRRRPKSKWSKINCDRALALVEQGQNAASGPGRDRRGQARWALGCGVRVATEHDVPEDFQRKLSENPRALKFFNELDAGTATRSCIGSMTRTSLRRGLGESRSTSHC